MQSANLREINKPINEINGGVVEAARALRRLLRDTPMSGRIQVSLEREPSFFAAARKEGERHYAIYSRDA